MKPIILSIADLKPALTGLGKAVVKRTALPVLSTIRIERTAEGSLRLSATDLDAYITVQLTAPCGSYQAANQPNEPDALLVPFALLNTIAKACRGDDYLEISPDSKGHVSIRYPIGSQIVSRRVESHPAEEWPPIPHLDGIPTPIPASLRCGLLEALQCASTDEHRPVLRGVCIDVSDKKCQSVVGTDGCHLYASNSFSFPLTESVIIPDHRFLAWRGFAEDGDWTLTLGPAHPGTPGNHGKHSEAAWMRLQSEHWTFITRPIEGTYPNWRQVLPNQNANQSSISFPEEIAPVIEAVQKLPDLDSTNHSIGLRLEKQRLTLLARNPGEDKFTEVAFPNAQTKGEPVTIFLNRNFLTKALRFGLRELQIHDPLSAMRFTAEGRQMVVMPVRPEHGAKTRSGKAEGQEPVPKPTPQPRVEPSTPTHQPEAQTERNTTMQPSTNGTNGKTEPRINGAKPDKSPLESAIEQTETLKGTLKLAITNLGSLSDALKQAQRDQKVGEREIQSVRAALSKLQPVRI